MDITQIIETEKKVFNIYANNCKIAEFPQKLFFAQKSDFWNQKEL